VPAGPRSERASDLPGWFPGEARPVGILLDFDGTLSEIAPAPEEARPARGVREALQAVNAAGAVVVVISGRRAREVAALLDAPVRSVGLYGLEDEEGPVGDAAGLMATADAALPDVERAAALVPGSRVEHKGFHVAVHYRWAPDPQAARRVLLERLGAVAEARGFRVLEGKKVVELAVKGGPTKGDVVEGIVRGEGLRAVMYAGDDAADLAAFEALGRLGREGISTLRVAVRHPEAPARLLKAADVVVDRPEEVGTLLADVAERLRGR
jgi:trehalose 6-phosphate phosphatase